MYRFTLMFSLIVLVSLSGLALADIPRLINYQGMLTDDAGNPLNATVSITFKIYTDSLSVSPELKKWEETQTGVEVVNGLFNVMLGRVTVLELDFSEDYWLDITVGSEHLPDRLRFVSVGYAYRAKTADSASVAKAAATGGGWTDDGSVVRLENNGDFVCVGTTTPSGKLTVDGGDAMIKGGDGWNESGDEASLFLGDNNHGISAVYGQGLRIWTFDDAISDIGFRGHTGTDYMTIRMNSGNVGIGTTDPLDKLHVSDGYVRTSHPYGLRMENQNGEYTYIETFGNELAFTSFSAGDMRFSTSDSPGGTAAARLFIENNGDIGIGTIHPERTLHMVGDNPRILIQAKTGNPEVNFMSSGDPASEIWALYKDTVSNDFRFHQNGDKVTIENSTGNVGIGATDPGQKLDVNGIARIRSWGSTPTYDVQVNNNGDLCRVSSSKRYKKNIRGLESHLDRILNLKPVSFEWKTTSERDVGLIAEDVHELIPELVGYDKEGRPDAVRYELLSLYLLEAMKELKAENEELKHRIEALEDR
jgi:hypothetical protein